ncbi:gibberellin-regulated protein 9-like [Quercus lobata]|uniref:Gibberellin-regulated protein 9 n=1 Tax=Quercus lobata TaxID=97700 RepID=A0A7N2QYZ6_QUELO|nr:gibberellin-regulated protein 9-like [Quercus lobata]
MKLFIIFAIVILLLQALAEASSYSTAANTLANMDEGENELALHSKHKPQKINCNYACSRRCKKASRKNRCTRACKSCCMRCHCVPPGTYGNKNACPCYARLKTHGNKLKCP